MKYDIYQQVTDRIIAQLENGVIPWKSPYFSKVGFPRNFSTCKAYQGINVFLLGSLRFTSPYFLTFIQAKELGGHIRKGEHGHMVIKYGTYTKTDKARAIIEAMPNRPKIHEGAAVPCYRPRSDSVHMPESRFFDSEEAYYSTLFHELAHATGHASRLARPSLLDNKGILADGDTARKTYAEEELVAEMSASFLNAHAGIIEDELANSAAYLAGWVDALKSKDAKSWIIRAGASAQKAANYILGAEPE